jgi:DNA-directed RNA polymerase I subunit RPA1
MAGAEVERYRRKLELLSQGRLREAQALVVGSSAAAKRSGGDLIDDAMDVDNIEEDTAEAEKGSKSAYEYNVSASVKRSAARAARGLGPRSPQILTAQTLEAMIETMGDFFKRQPNGKCQNCNAHNPGVKREGFSKLFAMPLPAKKRAANQVQGTEILSVLQRIVDGAKGVAEVEAELAASVQAKEAERKKRQEHKKEEEEQEEDSEEEEDDKEAMDVDGDHKDEKKVGITAAGSDSDGSEDGYDNKTGNKQPSTYSVLSSDTPKYLTPTEVREILRRMWEINEPILAYIYPTDVARRQRRRSPAAATAAAAGNNAARRSQGYKDFFVQTVPVAPNRFRPVNRVGDAVYEHPQNTLLVKLINGNLDLVAASKGETNLTSPSAAAAVAAMANDPQAQLGRTLRLWLELQNSVNALFDSSAADETHGVSGIRQQLEKKEGLFRKNMMGKRVNFAARSVISPDVYLNGGEIGVPPYFASRLSFPERVTPWNVERLREAVLAGPGRNPGAVAVEDERGRIIMLRKDKKSREAVAKTLYSNAAMASAAAAAVAAGTTPAAGGVGVAETTPSPLGGVLGGPTSALMGTTGATPGSTKGGPLAAADLAAAASAQFGGGKVVYRTMTDGDFMLTNRQPTLHKPGMMGHRARIMRGKRNNNVLRLINKREEIIWYR